MRERLWLSLIAFVIGLVMGALVNSATAQAPVRIFGTNSTTGAPVPITTSGSALQVNCQ